MVDISQYALFGASPYTVSLLVVGVTLFLILSYRWALPKPIPGIPYNASAVNSLLGDVPEMMEQMQKTDQIFPWLVSQTVKLQSPIVQVWARPFAKPWVIVADFKESQDILMRRTKEFDRSGFFGDLFTGIIPDHHIHRMSNDEKFKSNRFLMKDLMTPAFLHTVAAPQIYTAVTALIDLWTEKTEMAKGHPFSAFHDIYNAALDAIVAATFGLDGEKNTTSTQIEFLSNPSASTVRVSKDTDEAVDFPQAPNPPEFDAILTLTESLEPTIKSPVPRLHHWFLRQMPYMRKARALKESLINGQIEKATKRFAEGDIEKRCALDDVMHREMTAAKKEARAPVYTTRPISDELFGFLIAGHDTTSTTVSWGLKRLSDNPTAQTKLRAALRNAYAAATAEERTPTANEITKTQIPYLDAILEEIVRMALTASGVARVALSDTVVLGHHIPKGTDVFMLWNGPDYFEKSFQIEDSVRSETSRSPKGRQVGSWDPATMKSFQPERWLATDDAGNEVYDPLAGPHLSFGLGPRGCYGKRLAYLELRMIIVMIIWNFELQMCPEALSDYEAVDRLTRQPRKCFVKLEKAGF